MSAKRFFYVLCAVLGVIVVVAGGAYYLANQNLQTGTQQLSQKLGDEQLADERLAKLEDLQKQYQRLQPLLPSIYNALPQEKKQSTLAVQLRNIATSSGMDLETLTFTSTTVPGPTSQTVKVGDVLAVPVSFQLTGTYEQLQQFLSKQQKLDRYTSITALDISQADKPNLLTFKVTLNAYLKP